MDNTTENVTLIAAFVKNVIDLYEGKPSYQEKLNNIAKGLDLSNPMKHVPMATYNEMCQWIENEIGVANTRILGRKIGTTAYESMVAMGFVKANSTPLELMEGLQKVAQFTIKDPKNRGWEIIDKSNKHIVMRRTQTFNGTLQFGLLDEIIRKAKVVAPKVELIKTVKNGDEFDDYKITWL